MTPRGAVLTSGGDAPGMNAATRRLAAPIVSIGGAGTFDGISVTGILAVLT
jgi:uncharacterized membrane protein